LTREQQRELALEIAETLRLHPVYDRVQIQKIEWTIEQWVRAAGIEPAP
jgi:hypothetical protein